MIVIANKRKKIETLEKEFPGCVVIDVTSNSSDGDFVKFSPFYPHGGIPVPGMKLTAASVEGIWQGLKTFESGEGISTETLLNRTMKNIKRTVRTHGRCKGHLYGDRLLEYIEARKLIYLPSYRWVLENRLQDLCRKLKVMSASRTVVLLDYETNTDVEDWTKPLSHASLVKEYVDAMQDVAAPTPDSAPLEKVDLEAGCRVRHAKFGDGTVKAVDDQAGRVVVDFDAAGEKTLALRLARLEKI